MVEFQKDLFFKHFHSSFKRILKELFAENFLFERIKLAYENFGGDPLQLHILTTLLMKPLCEENNNPLFFCLQRRIQHHLVMFYSLVQTIYAEKMLLFLRNNLTKLDQWGIFLLNSNSDMNKASIISLKNIKSIKRDSFGWIMDNDNKLFEVIEIDSDNESDFILMCNNDSSKINESKENAKSPESNIKKDDHIDEISKSLFLKEEKLGVDLYDIIITFRDNKNQQKQFEDIYKHLAGVNEDHIADFINSIFAMKLPNTNKILHYLITVRVIHSHQFISRTMYNIILDLFNNNLKFLLEEFFCAVILNQDFSNCHEDIFRKLIYDQYFDVPKIEIVLKNVMKLSANPNFNSAHISLFDCLLREKPNISQNDFNSMLVHFSSPSLTSCVKLMSLTIFLIETYPCQVVQSYNALKHIILLNNTFLKKNAKKILEKLEVNI